jgi:hypothetical protein
MRDPARDDIQVQILAKNAFVIAMLGFVGFAGACCTIIF